MTTQVDVIGDRAINHSRVWRQADKGPVQPMAAFLADMDALIVIPKATEDRKAYGRDQVEATG